ncbi:MAG: type I DNA topoisomerase [Acidobacteria bacterium]|nr:type I DNA topoisomerase [Acidobacteriota bacterium]
MPRSIVIVESPAKARTIEKYLGKDFIVRASSGHIKDLPKGGLGVDIKHDFHPTYRIIPGKEKIIRDLRKDAEKSDAIYLAADPDREGEAICQHLAEELEGARRGEIRRVLFNEITRNAILSAFKNPSRIDRNKVEAQQARRILDRLVGYKVSPLLWQKVRRGLSAGRVQSVALRMIVDREREIRSFVSEEYWNIIALLAGLNPPPFSARAVKHGGKKLKISNRQEADSILAELRAAAFLVADVQKKERKRNPVPPFITSTLQQEAVRKLRFSVSKTMSVAQRLYEGIDIGEEAPVGLITYMRSDSTRVAESALQEVRAFIGQDYGAQYLPSKPAIYKTRKAQDAHEAIRPTSALRLPDLVKPHLSRDEARLYELIWKRFVASQMNPARFDQTEIKIKAGKVELKATGSVLKFDGFLRLYQETPDEVAEPEGGESLLPEVSVGEKLTVQKLLPEQKFTQPPARYSEATLVKALEEKGIGRPSTYAQILGVIMRRDYVTKQDGRFVPTELGEIVIELLVENFEEIFNYDYTAKLEQNLDEIESGQEEWVHTLKDFYSEFSKELQQARAHMKNLKKEEIPSGVLCEKCGSEMNLRWGRFGKFLACSNYPQCKNTRKSPEENGNTVEKNLEEPCPRCGSPLRLRSGRYGEFIACSSYPHCKYTRQDSTGVKCPHCNQGELVQRKSRRGRIFYSCDQFPECKFVVWNKPVPQECPSCGAPYLLERNTKREGLVRYCGVESCRFKQAVEPVAAE